MSKVLDALIYLLFHVCFHFVSCAIPELVDFIHFVSGRGNVILVKFEHLRNALNVKGLFVWIPKNTMHGLVSRITF